MTPLSALLISLGQIWTAIKRPAFIIVYMTFLVLLMLVIIIATMVNERRFSNLTMRLDESAEKAEKQAEEAQSGSRFEMLRLIDERRKTTPKTAFTAEFTLEELCERFRNFAASRLGLYYEISTVREFVAGLAVSHFLILEGMSGTGKTSLAFAFGEFLSNPSVIVPVQPMWKERSDLLGYYNEFTKKFNETQLLQKMYEANGREDIYVTVLDELNIARVEYYFAEFLSLMEIPNPESRYLEIVSDRRDDDPEALKDGAVKLPGNMWFLGTANNDDSTFSISDKVYDRTMIIDLDHKAESFEAPDTPPMPVSAEAFEKAALDAVRTVPVSEEDLNRLDLLDAYLREAFGISFGNRIMKQILSYLPIYEKCGGSQTDALDDILAKKVLRKLEGKNLAYRKAEADALIAYLDELFGVGAMKKCAAAVAKAAKNS